MFKARSKKGQSSGLTIALGAVTAVVSLAAYLYSVTVHEHRTGTTAAEAAALEAAMEFGYGVVVDPKLGYVGLSNVGPNSSNHPAKHPEFNPDINPALDPSKPVTGINTLLASARLGVVVAGKLNPPNTRLQTAAQKLLDHIRNDVLPALNSKLNAIRPVVAQHAQAVYQANCKSGVTLDQASFSLQLGSLSGGAATNLFAQDYQHTSYAIDSNFYKAYVPIPVVQGGQGAETVAFSAVANQAELVNPQSFLSSQTLSDGKTVVPLSVVLVSASNKLSSNRSDGSVSSQPVLTSACAIVQSSNAAVSAADTALTVSFSGGIPLMNGHSVSLADLMNLPDAVAPAFDQQGGTRPNWFQNNTGLAWGAGAPGSPVTGQLTQADGSDPDYPAVEGVSTALIDRVAYWILTIANRADYFQLTGALNQPLQDPKQSNFNLVAPEFFSQANPSNSQLFYNADARFGAFDPTKQPSSAPQGQQAAYSTVFGFQFQDVPDFAATLPSQPPLVSYDSTTGEWYVAVDNPQQNNRQDLSVTCEAQDALYRQMTASSIIGDVGLGIAKSPALSTYEGIAQSYSPSDPRNPLVNATLPQASPAGTPWNSGDPTNSAAFYAGWAQFIANGGSVPVPGNMGFPISDPTNGLVNLHNNPSPPYWPAGPSWTAGNDKNYQSLYAPVFITQDGLGQQPQSAIQNDPCPDVPSYDNLLPPQDAATGQKQIAEINNFLATVNPAPQTAPGAPKVSSSINDILKYLADGTYKLGDPNSGYSGRTTGLPVLGSYVDPTTLSAQSPLQYTPYQGHVGMYYWNWWEYSHILWIANNLAVCAHNKYDEANIALSNFTALSSKGITKGTDAATGQSYYQFNSLSNTKSGGKVYPMANIHLAAWNPSDTGMSPANPQYHVDDCYLDESTRNSIVNQIGPYILSMSLNKTNGFMDFLPYGTVHYYPGPEAALDIAANGHAGDIQVNYGVPYINQRVGAQCYALYSFDLEQVKNGTAPSSSQIKQWDEQYLVLDSYGVNAGTAGPLATPPGDLLSVLHWLNNDIYTMQIPNGPNSNPAPSSVPTSEYHRGWGHGLNQPPAVSTPPSAGSTNPYGAVFHIIVKGDVAQRTPLDLTQGQVYVTRKSLNLPKQPDPSSKAYVFAADPLLAGQHLYVAFNGLIVPWTDSNNETHQSYWSVVMRDQIGNTASGAQNATDSTLTNAGGPLAGDNLWPQGEIQDTIFGGSPFSGYSPTNGKYPTEGVHVHIGSPLPESCANQMCKPLADSYNQSFSIDPTQPPKKVFGHALTNGDTRTVLGNTAGASPNVAFTTGSQMLPGNGACALTPSQFYWW